MPQHDIHCTECDTGMGWGEEYYPDDVPVRELNGNEEQFALCPECYHA